MNKKIRITDNLKKPSTRVSYGTAGYRSNTSDLVNIICRSSFIAYLRSSSFAGKRIGIMITASHNPVDYNGVKFIDHNGNLLDKAWEKCSDDLVNCEDKDFHNMLNKILRKNSNLCDIDDGITGHVVIGRDTRESGQEISDNIKDVLSQVDCVVEDYGVLSTPEMHYLIRMSNNKNVLEEKDNYLDNLLVNYRKLRDLTKYDLPILADTANGVVKKNITKDMGITIINENTGILNEKCGADFVKTYNQVPLLNNFNFKNEKENTLFASFDGDADRLIFFTLQNDFTLIDGDAQAVILANYIRNLIDSICLRLRIGVVLSYYSNGAALDSLIKFDTEMVQTGVKNTVKAAKKYDIGIYFEPNGHGSVIFSNNAIQAFNSGNTKEYEILQTISNMFDPCIGDALANLLVFKCILSSVINLKPYKENGSRLLTVKVKDKSLMTVDDQNDVLYPKTLQERINEEIDRCGGRAFVRPSGTEDLVRIYAECPNQQDSDILALKVAQLVYDMCEGIGNHPEIDYSK
ncbi:hypothetical protein P3W45_000862 [Vairimorpha bombi]|jgi:phosphoacetylglucosamine mutase